MVATNLVWIPMRLAQQRINQLKAAPLAQEVQADLQDRKPEFPVVQVLLPVRLQLLARHPLACLQQPRKKLTASSSRRKLAYP